MILDPAAVMSLAVRCAPEAAPQTLLAIARVESGLNPLAVGVNGKAPVAQPRSEAEAAALAARLIAQGTNVDLGLAQINSANLTRLGLSLASVFDPCRNLAAAATLLKSDYQAVRLTLSDEQQAVRAALSLYNTGNRRAGFHNGYVARVAAAARARGPSPALSSQRAPDRHPPPDRRPGTSSATSAARLSSYVAGYGLRLLPVLQSPAQLRAEYGPDLAEEIIANCGVEIAFAPKELKVARDLSKRLGFYTYAGRARSRPAGLSAGRRSQTESDQRRALMMPQELIQMPSDQLLALRAGLPPARGRKIVYWRERELASRVVPPPKVAPRPLAAVPPGPDDAAAAPNGDVHSPASLKDDDLRLTPPFAAELEPLPPNGGSPAQMKAFADQQFEMQAGRSQAWSRGR